MSTATTPARRRRGYVIPTTQAHVEALIQAGLRAQDRDEVLAMGRDPAEALRESVEASMPDVWTFVSVGDDGEDARPVVIFGVAPYLGSRHHGVPWLLASDGIFEVVEDFKAQATAWVNHINDRSAVLINFVSEHNTKARQWLDHAGFVFDGQSDTIGDVAFLKFYRAGAPTSH